VWLLEGAAAQINAHLPLLVPLEKPPGPQPILPQLLLQFSVTAFLLSLVKPKDSAILMALGQLLLLPATLLVGALVKATFRAHLGLPPPSFQLQPGIVLLVTVHLPPLLVSVKVMAFGLQFLIHAKKTCANSQFLMVLHTLSLLKIHT